jgi:2-C-methyl-D-erythritol 4-phosphate cytidylyltransferase/2-C-methyl-D-erythritol 2,4-cyclodiphosphate synthase
MENNKKIGVIIVAGGSGSRFGAEIPKQYMQLAGKPILQHSIEAFSGFADFIQVVIRREDVEVFKQIENALKDFGMQILPPIFGAATRQGSVKNGLISLEKVGCDVVLIHDAARPLVSTEVIENVLNGVAQHKFAIPAVAQKDTLKLVKKGFVEKTVSRKNLFCAQTPQGFEFGKIYEAHKKFQDFEYTDDASLIEALGEKVAIVEGDDNNLKITTKKDLAIAELILGME